ncbi:MAG: Fis family transcriptional regulator [Burkholderiales bacterium]|nr:Fis family transcriptional regulator [Burkholderiales bacterium]
MQPRPLAPRPASGPFFTTPAQRTQLARERFFEQGQRPTGMVGEAVLQSWTRCLGAGLQPQQRPEFEPVTRARTKAVLERSHPLLQAAAPEVHQLDAMLAGTGCKSLLTDREGIVVHATPAGSGAGALLDTIGRIGVYLGEPNFGSTAPGISLSTGLDSTVAGAEHFFGVLQQLHCAAAPVRDREGRMAGVLDLSIQGGPFAFDALALVRQCVTVIENRLFAAQSAQEVMLCFQASPALLGTPLEGRVAVTEDGRVVGLNAAGAQLLRPAPDGGTPDVETLLGMTVGTLHRLLQSRAPAPHRLPSGLRLWMRAEPPACRHVAVPRVAGDDGADAGADTDAGATVPRRNSIAPPPQTPSLRAVSDQLIEDTLRQCGGNVAKAARTLGVSRGLLYRRRRPAAQPA